MYKNIRNMDFKKEQGLIFVMKTKKTKIVITTLAIIRYSI